MLFLPATLFPPPSVEYEWNSMGVLAVVTTNDLYQIANRDSGAFVRSANYLLIATDWTGSRTWRQGWGNRTGWKATISASVRSPSSSHLPRDGGSGLLVWVNTQGWHGLQKPELEKGIRKEDLYIKAVRIVARDGGLGPAGDGGLK